MFTTASITFSATSAMLSGPRANAAAGASKNGSGGRSKHGTTDKVNQEAGHGP